NSPKPPRRLLRRLHRSSRGVNSANAMSFDTRRARLADRFRFFAPVNAGLAVTCSESVFLGVAPIAVCVRVGPSIDAKIFFKHPAAFLGSWISDPEPAVLSVDDLQRNTRLI